VTDLKANAANVWLDRLDIRPGSQWDSEVEKALIACSEMLLILSPTSVDSRNVMDEVHFALEENKRIIPVMHRYCRVPFRLRRVQHIDFQHDYQPALGSLLAELAHDDLLATHTTISTEVSKSIPSPPARDGNWIVIPSSTFLMGAQKEGANRDPDAYANEAPVHEVTLKAFQIGRFPVTVREYDAFIKDGGYEARKFWIEGFGRFKEPESWETQKQNLDWPVVGVSWYEAAAYCSWAGGRLPTESEWERTARGPQNGRYPWGNQPALDHSYANYEGRVGHPTPVGLYPKGNSLEGVSDLLGNVWEWCSDWYGPYSANIQENPPGAKNGHQKILRGGSWGVDPGGVRVSDRGRNEPANRIVNFGFRCVRDLP